MKKRTHTPVVREYENPRYAVWTTAPRGTAPSSKEVIITGKCDDSPKAALAKKIGLDFGDLLTRVQVIKKGPKRFVAWVTVVDDNIYPFVESFNRNKKMSGCKAALKHNVDCAKKVVLHGVKGKTEDDIKAMLGTTKVKNVLKKHNTAFVVMESETYAEALLRNVQAMPVELEAKRFLPRPRDPVKAVSKRLTKMHQELLAVVDDLRHQVSVLKEMASVNRIPFASPSPRTPDRISEFEPSTPSTTDDWESIMPESHPATPTTVTQEPTNNTIDEDARNRAILELVLNTSEVFKKVKKEIAARAIMVDRARSTTTEEDPVELDLSNPDCELQSPQLNEHKKRSARVTVGDTAANKIPARLASIKSGALRRSYQLARTTEPSDLTSGAPDGSGGPRNESLKKGSKQHSKKRMNPVA